MKDLLKLSMAIAANPVLGTWHAAGFNLPDVRSNDATLWLHNKLTRTAHLKSLAMLRVGLMHAFKAAATLNEHILRGDAFVQRMQEIDDRLLDSKARGADGLPRNLAFFGSGVDAIRTFDELIRDLGLMNGIAPVSEENRFGAYAYKASSTLRFSTAWFARLQDAYRLNIKPDFASQEAREFVRKHFLPLVSDGDFVPRRIDVNDARDNMRFTLSGQSYGGTFIQMLVNALYDEMKKLEYEDAEIQSIFDNIFVLNVSGAAFASDRLDRPSPKTVFVEHIYDFVGFQTDRHDTHPYFLGETAMAEEGIKLSDNRRFYWRDFHWKDANHPDGIALPDDDSYGYHDIRSVVQDIPQQVRSAVRIALESKGPLPPLDIMLGETPHRQKPVAESSADHCRLVPVA